MAHILAIPLPLQGHINPLMQLCHRLASKGIRVTIVITSSISTRLGDQPETGNDLISIETVADIPIDHTGEDLDVYEAFFRSYRAAITSGISDIIEKLGNSLKAIVYDSVSPWILDIAHEKGLKGAVLFTQPATVCAIFNHLHKGSLEIPPDGSSQLVSLPALPVMEVKDLPSLVYDMGSYPSILNALIEQFSTFEKADWRLFNTFDKLENEILIWMSEKYPIHTIGPAIPSAYTDRRLSGNYDYGLSFFKPNSGSCMKWLDEKEDRSVIYVSFGSLADISVQQMEEVAYGLIDSKCTFLWVVRDTEQSKLPQDLITSRLMEKGLIVNWCAQLKVLSHRAIGCFFTHGGWNSTLEALSLGVPLVVMPQWTDQTTNAKLIVDVWQVGLRVRANGDGIFMREEIAARVHDVVQRERGDQIRRNVLKWKDLAIEAVSEGGSSDKNVEEFANELLTT